MRRPEVMFDRPSFVLTVHCFFLVPTSCVVLEGFVPDLETPIFRVTCTFVVFCSSFLQFIPNEIHSPFSLHLQQEG